MTDAPQEVRLTRRTPEDQVRFVAARLLEEVPSRAVAAGMALTLEMAAAGLPVTAIPDWADDPGDAELIAFVRARLAEDEAAAEAALAAEWTVSAPGSNVSLAPAGGEAVRDAGYVAAAASVQYARHIARHAPARVLRECAAKRDRLDDYRRAVAACQTAPAYHAASLRSYKAAAWGAVLADARVWAAHEDFQAKWR